LREAIAAFAVIAANVMHTRSATSLGLSKLCPGEELAGLRPAGIRVLALCLALILLSLLMLLLLLLLWVVASLQFLTAVPLGDPAKGPHAGGCLLHETLRSVLVHLVKVAPSFFLLFRLVSPLLDTGGKIDSQREGAQRDGGHLQMVEELVAAELTRHGGLLPACSISEVYARHLQQQKSSSSKVRD